MARHLVANLVTNGARSAAISGVTAVVILLADAPGVDGRIHFEEAHSGLETSIQKVVSRGANGVFDGHSLVIAVLLALRLAHLD